MLFVWRFYMLNNWDGEREERERERKREERERLFIHLLIMKH